MKDEEFDRDVDQAEKKAERASKNIDNSFQRVGQRLTSLGRGIGKYVGIPIAALGLTAAGGGPLVAGVAALGATFAAAGVGVAAFGAVAIPTLSTIFEKQKAIEEAQKKVNEATTEKEKAAALKELEAAYSGLSEKQKESLKALQDFKSFWSGFTKEFESPVLDIFTKSLTAVRGVLEPLRPTISETAAAISDLIDSFNQNLNAEPVKEFFQFLGETAYDRTMNFGQMFGNTMRGIMGLMEAFDPLAASMEQGMVKMTDSFAKWAEGLSESKGFQEFIEYVKTNGPVLLSILESAFSVIGRLLVALAPVGELLLKAVDQLLKGLDALIQHPAVQQGFQKMKEGVEQLIPYIENAKQGFESIKNGLQSFGEKAMEIWSIIGPYVQQALFALVAFAQEKLAQLKQFWDENGALILQSAQNLWNQILAVIQFAMPIISSIIRDAWTIITGIFNGALNMILGLIQMFVGIFNGNWSAAWEGAKQILSGAVQIIWALIRDTFLGRIISSIIEFVSQAIAKFNDLKDRATAKFQEIVSAAQEKFNSLKEKITGPIEEARNTVSRIVEEIKGFFSNMSLKLPDIQMPSLPKLPKIEISGGFSLSPPSVPSIRWAAQGALIKPGNPTLIGVGDARGYDETVLPLRQDTYERIGLGVAKYLSPFNDVIDKIMAMLAKMMPQSSNRPINMYIDGKLFAQVTGDYTDAEGGVRIRRIQRGLA